MGYGVRGVRKTKDLKPGTSYVVQVIVHPEPRTSYPVPYKKPVSSTGSSNLIKLCLPAVRLLHPRTHTPGRGRLFKGGLLK